MMRAAFFGAGGFDVREVPDPLPLAGEVVVRVHACGICGSDLHYYQRLEPGPAVCPGHEICGRLMSGCLDLPAGRDVVVEPIVGCGTCPSCAGGEPNLCPFLRIVGRHRAGGFADTVVVPVQSIHPIPDGLDLDAAVLTEPLAVAIHASDRAATSAGMAVLVIGGGTIGLLSAFVAVRAGADVTLVVRHSHQRALARDLGIARIIDALPDGGLPPIGLEAAPDVVFETVGGRAPTLAIATACVRPGGTVVMVGVFSGPVSIDGGLMLAKEVRLVPSMTYRRRGAEPDFVRALRLLLEERSRLAKLVTHRLPLDEIDRAFALAAAKRSGAIKVAVQPDQNL